MKTVHVQDVWSTAIVVDVRHENTQKTLVDQTIEETVEFFNKVDRDFSPFKPSSFTSLIASGALKPYDAPDNVL